MVGTVRNPPAAIDFDAIRSELGIPAGYPQAAVADAIRAAALPPDDRAVSTIPFVTLDPVGSMDLDQAVHLARDGDGYLVRYAIADVAHSSRRAVRWRTRRGVAARRSTARTATRRCTRCELSEGAASLLPDRRARPCCGRSGWTAAASRSRSTCAAYWSRPWPSWTTRPSRPMPTPAAFTRRSRCCRRSAGCGRSGPASATRSAWTCPIPRSSGARTGSGRWSCGRVLPVEQYNAEISLLTGICAAPIMLDGGIGLLRTLPPPTARAGRARCGEPLRSLASRGRTSMPAGDVIAGLDGADPKDAAFLEDAVRLLRGAGYTPFDGRATEHAASTAASARPTRTSPRRCAGWPTGSPPRSAWRCMPASRCRPGRVDALPELPKAMGAADRKASELAKACAGAVSVFVLHGREGEEFEATVLQIDAEPEPGDRDPARAAGARALRADGLVEGSVIRCGWCPPTRRPTRSSSSRSVVHPGVPDRGPVQLVAGCTAWETTSARTRPSTTTSTPAQVEREGQSKAKDLLGPFPTEAGRRQRAGDHPRAGAAKEAEDREWRDR